MQVQTRILRPPIVNLHRPVINSGSLTLHSQTHPAFLYADAGYYRYYARLQLDSIRPGFECCRIFLDFRAQI